MVPRLPRLQRVSFVSPACEMVTQSLCGLTESYIQPVITKRAPDTHLTWRGALLQLNLYNSTLNYLNPFATLTCPEYVQEVRQQLQAVRF